MFDVDVDDKNIEDLSKNKNFEEVRKEKSDKSGH